MGQCNGSRLSHPLINTTVAHHVAPIAKMRGGNSTEVTAAMHSRVSISAASYSASAEAVLDKVVPNRALNVTSIST